MKGQAFKWDPDSAPPILQDHSERKLTLIRNYLRRYLEVMGGNRRADRVRLTLVDGFAGGGTFQLDGSEVSGTPLVMLEEVDRARRVLNDGRAKPLAVEASFVFIEKQKDNHEHLRRTLQERGYTDRLGPHGVLLRGTFEKHFDDVVERVRKQHRDGRSIFLLDQTGYNKAPFALVRRILTEMPTSEVILTFGVDWLVDYMTTADPFLKAVEPIGFDRAEVERLLGYKDGAGGRVLIQQVLARMVQEKIGAPFTTPFFVHGAAAHRSLWIVHLSTHPKARDVMLEQHWGLGNGALHQGPGSLYMLGHHAAFDQLALFDFGFDPMAERKLFETLQGEVPEALWTDGAAEGVRFGDWRVGRANRTAATKAQLSEALRTLATDGEIEIFTTGGRPKRLTARLNDSDVIRTPQQRSSFSLLR